VKDLPILPQGLPAFSWAGLPAVFLADLPAVLLEDLSAVIFIRQLYGGLAGCFR
jgi:hypothetical protein